MAKIVPNIPAELKRDWLLESEDDFELSSISSQQEKAEGLRLITGELYQSLVDGLRVSKSVFKNINFTDVIFSDCEFHEHSFDNCSFHRVIFRKCAFVSTTFNKCFWVDVLMDNVQGKYISMLGVKFKGCEIKDSLLPYAFFHHCVLNKLSLKDVSLKYLEASETSFYGVDFSRSDLEGFKVPLESLKGATLPQGAGLALLVAMGIKIAF